MLWKLTNTYEKTNEMQMYRKMRWKTWCSKDFDDISPKVEGSYNFSNLDELLKDAKLIHAFLPRFSHRLIYRKLYNNQFARERE